MAELCETKRAPKRTKIELKTSRLCARALFLRCSGAIFMPSRSVVPVLSAFRSSVLFAFLCSAKKLAKQHPTGLEYFKLPFAPIKSHAADIERGFEPNNIRSDRNYVRYRIYRQKSPDFVQIPYSEWVVRQFRNKLREHLEYFGDMCYTVHCNIVSILLSLIGGK